MKILRSSLLILLLAASTQAGWMGNGSPNPDPTPTPTPTATTTETTEPSEPISVQEIEVQIVLDVLETVLSLI